MSVTIEQQPQSYAPGFNPLMVVASSTQSASPNFRFVVRVKESQGGANIATFRVSKRPDNALLLFDAHRVVENFLTFDITNITTINTGFKKGVNVFKKYAVNVQEEYSLTVNDPITVHASGTTSDLYAFNGALSAIDIRAYDFNDYLINGTGLRRFLTNQPEHVKVRTADTYELGMFQIPVATPNKLKSLKIEPFDAAGNALPSGTIDNPEAANTADDARFMSILCGPADLNASSLTTGSQPIIPTNTAYYRVSTIDNSAIRTSEYKYFDMDTRCTQSYIRVFFLNRLGSIDAFNFIRVSDRNIDVQRSTYDKTEGQFNGSAFELNDTDSGKEDFHIRYDNKWLLRSDWLTEAESEWLQELITSPMVMMLYNGKFMRMQVADASYQPKTYKNQKLFKLDLNLTQSLGNYSQRL